MKSAAVLLNSKGSDGGGGGMFGAEGGLLLAPETRVPLQVKEKPSVTPVADAPSVDKAVTQKPAVVNKPASTDKPSNVPAPQLEDDPGIPLPDTSKVTMDDFTKIVNPEKAAKDEAEKVKKGEVKEEPVAKPSIDKFADRDFTGIEEADIPMFKEMSKAAHARIRPVYLEQKKNKAEIETLRKQNEDLKKGVVGAVPETYYEHPDAVVLTPDFKKAVQDKNFHQAVAEHWQDQLIAVAEGAKEIEVLDFNKETGQLYVSKKVPATPRNEAELQTYVRRSEANLAEANSKIGVLRSSFGARHQEALKFVNEMQQRSFGWMDANAEHKPKFDAMIQQTIGMFPPVYQKNPLLGLLVRSLLVNNELGARLKSGDTTTATKQQPTPEAKPNANPSSDEITGGSVAAKGGNGVVTDIMGAFNKAKNS